MTVTQTINHPIKPSYSLIGILKSFKSALLGHEMDRTGHELDTKKVTNHPIYQSEHPTMGTSVSLLIRYETSDICNLFFFGIF